MTYETNKAYLASFISKRNKVQRLYRRLSQLNTRLGVPSSAALTGMPTGSNGTRHDFGDLVAERDRIQQQLQASVGEAVAVRTAIQTGLKELSYNESLLINCHYLQGYSMPELIESVSASEATIRRTLDSGVRSIQLPTKGGAYHER